MPADFHPGLHVTGTANPERVVAQLGQASVACHIQPPARRAWASIALAKWLADRNRAAIRAYQE